MIELTFVVSGGLWILVELRNGGFTNGEKIWHEFRALVMDSFRWSDVCRWIGVALKRSC